MKKFCLLMLLTILLSGLGVASASAKMTEMLDISEKTIEARDALINAEAPEGNEMLFGYGDGAGLFYYGDFFIVGLHENQGEMCMTFRSDATSTDGAHIITNQRYKYVIVNERNNLIGVFANVKKEYDEPNNGVHVVELKHYYADVEGLAEILDFTVPVEQHQVISFPLNVAEYDTYADLMGNLDKSYLLVFEANATDLSGLKYKIPFNKLINHYDENVFFGNAYPVKDESEALYPIEGEFGYVDAIFKNIVYDANQEPTGFIATVSYDILNDFSVFPGTGATLESIEVFTSDNSLCFSERFRYDDANAYRGTFDIVVDGVINDDYTFVFKTNTGLEEKRVVTVSGLESTQVSTPTPTPSHVSPDGGSWNVSPYDGINVDVISPNKKVTDETIRITIKTSIPCTGTFNGGPFLEEDGTTFIAEVSENGTYTYDFQSIYNESSMNGWFLVWQFEDTNPTPTEVPAVVVPEPLPSEDSTDGMKESEDTGKNEESNGDTPANVDNQTDIAGLIGSSSCEEGEKTDEVIEPTSTPTPVPVVDADNETEDSVETLAPIDDKNTKEDSVETPTPADDEEVDEGMSPLAIGIICVVGIGAVAGVGAAVISNKKKKNA